MRKKKKKTNSVEVCDSYVDQARGGVKKGKTLLFPWKRGVFLDEESPEYIKARGLFPLPKNDNAKKIGNKLDELRKAGLISAADKETLQLILNIYYLWQEGDKLTYPLCELHDFDKELNQVESALQSLREKKMLNDKAYRTIMESIYTACHMNPQKIAWEIHHSLKNRPKGRPRVSASDNYLLISLILFYKVKNGKQAITPEMLLDHPLKMIERIEGSPGQKPWMKVASVMAPIVSSQEKSVKRRGKNNTEHSLAWETLKERYRAFKNYLESQTPFSLIE